ncbi:GH39 family glycosyl hydrolase [Cellulomonas sp. Leaf395]|uniref:GH39 family glycosyl hydrolase n=1 Tax=Cellulomonas sp. Leaf395 TaxID=1736362 RepID=UPI0006F20F85|nr:xylan 1,4-beta-xylosidase [Cellulomonas sp. Leaf395]KQS98926.1 xylan 1,4-beta-xylosidase [Cellulomonas sp. Leaf395]
MSDARTDWESRIGRRSDATAAGGIPVLAPPAGLHAAPGVGQVTLHWEPVAGAVGYQVLRDGTPLDHQGGDVLAVPHGPYADTTGEPGVAYRYAVATVTDVDVTGPAGDEVVAASLASGTGTVEVLVDLGAVVRELPRPWRPMIGSEHLSLLLSDETVGGQSISADLTSALRAAHDELGVATVRAHAILCDDLGVYREVDGEPVHDFTRVDATYDALLALGLRPVVELSYMPRDLASDPDVTVFGYRAIVSPPRDWDRWAALITDLVGHLVQRYGLDEVRERWSFEVWNEPNLEVFWSGTRDEFWRLYDVTVNAVREVDDRLVVGGPSTAAAGWVDGLLEHVASSGAPVDFVSTHTYGNAPLDVRPTLARHGREDAQIWWTEWGVSPTHFGNSNDGVFSAAFLVRGMRSAAGRIEALSYWVVSDQFEELGRPPRLLHGGFGLRTVGELRKPRWWALWLLEQLGRDEVAATVTGDGADSLVEVWASRDDDRIAVALWNGTLDQSKVDGSAALGRTAHVSLDGLPDGTWTVRESRVDADHSNIAAVWSSMSDGADWPTDEQWAQLREADRLAVTERPLDGSSLDVDLPNPSIVLIELVRV